MPNMTFAQALNDAHKVEMTRDPNIYIAGEDVGVYGGIFGVTAGLLDQFGDKRVKDTPITESAIVGTAVGAATVGLRPVIELMFVDFIGVALDQLYNQAGKMKYMFGGKGQNSHGYARRMRRRDRGRGPAFPVPGSPVHAFARAEGGHAQHAL